MDLIQLNSDIEIAHIGPPLSKGRLPSVFYFALSARESLELDPYNQPALYLAEKGIRVFSVNLPEHGPNLSALDAIAAWANAFASGQDPLAPFLEKTLFSIDLLIEKGFIVREKIGLMGLSRGGLIASLIAAKRDVRSNVVFAPMTQLAFAREFSTLDKSEAIESYNLQNHIAVICHLPMRIYIGNRDTRVGTHLCMELALELANTAYENGNRSPPIELIISPSIGHMGHGTSKPTFEAGAKWLAQTLGVLT